MDGYIYPRGQVAFKTFKERIRRGHTRVNKSTGMTVTGDGIFVEQAIIYPLRLKSGVDFLSITTFLRNR